MTKPIHTPAHEEQQQTNTQRTALITFVLRHLLPELTADTSVHTLLYQFLFGKSNAPSLELVQCKLQAKAKQSTAFEDFLGVMEGAKIAISRHHLHTPALLDQWLEQQYQHQSPFQSSKSYSPTTNSI